MTATRHGVLAILALLLVTHAAAAQEAPSEALQARCSQWIDEGIGLRAERRNEEALERFQRAWEAGHGAEARAQMALAEQALGRWVEAERDLASARESLSEPWIARNRRNLDDALAEIRRHLGRLEIRCQVAGARAEVNGRDEGSLPLSAPLRVVVGTVTVEVTAPAHAATRRVLDVRPGDDLVEQFDLAPARAPSDASGVLGPVVLRRATDSAMTTWGNVLWVGAGASGLAGVTGLLWRQLSVSNFNEARDAPCLVDPVMPDVVHGAPECAGLRSQTATATGLAVAGFVAAGALAIGGLALRFAAPTRAGRARVACAGGWLSAACGVSF